jgi:hypothetical protein
LFELRTTLNTEAQEREKIKEVAKRYVEAELGKARKGDDRRTDLGKFVDYLPRLIKALKAGPGALKFYNDRAEYYGEEPLDDALEKALKKAVADCIAELRRREKAAERQPRFKKDLGRPPVSVDRRELEQKTAADLMNCAEPPPSFAIAMQLVQKLTRPKA